MKIWSKLGDLLFGYDIREILVIIKNIRAEEIQNVKKEALVLLDDVKRDYDRQIENLKKQFLKELIKINCTINTNDKDAAFYEIKLSFKFTEDFIRRTFLSCGGSKPDFYALAAKYITDLTMEEMQKVIGKKRTIINH